MKKQRKFLNNGPTYEMQLRYHNGRITAAQLLAHCEFQRKLNQPKSTDQAQ